MELIEIYADYGVQGLTILFFFATLLWFRGFITKLVNEELDDIRNEIVQNRDIQIKLIDRWNRESDENIRRHDNLVKEINDATDLLNRMDGVMSRLNGHK